MNKARDRAEVIAQKMSHVRHKEERDAFESIDGVADAHTVVRVPVSTGVVGMERALRVAS